jgi:hypothetical protein
MNERYNEKNKLIRRKEQWKIGKETTLTLLEGPDENS